MKRAKIPSIRVAVTLDAEDFAFQLDTSEAFDFVVMLDEAREEWDFTLRLADHFDKLRAEHAKEQAEDAAKLTKAAP